MPVIQPEVIFALQGINPQLMDEFIKNLVEQRNYIHLNMDYVVDHAKKRGTVMGKKFTEYDSAGQNIPIEAALE